MKHFKIMFFTGLFIIITTMASFSHSLNWHQEDGHWRVKNDSGAPLVNTWFCDNTDGKESWYLLDSNGNMVVGLAQDISGKCYSMETTPGDDYGKMRCKDGFYDGVYLRFNPAGDIINVDDVKTPENYIFMIATGNSVYANPPSSPQFAPQEALEDDDWEELDLSNGNYREVMRSQHIGMFLKGKEAKEIVEQTLAEFDSHNISVSDELAGVIVRGPLGDSITIFSLDSDMRCRFIDPTTGALLPSVSKIKSVKNIKKAIYKLSR